MANMLTGTYGNANEQVFYGNSGGGQKESAQMIFPNGDRGTVGGGEFVTVTKYVTGIFGEKYPITTVEFVPNKPVKIEMANTNVLNNIAYAPEVAPSGWGIGQGLFRDSAPAVVEVGNGMMTGVGYAGGSDPVVGDGSVMSGGSGMIGGMASVGQPRLAKSQAPAKAKSCPPGWNDSGMLCTEPMIFGCREGDQDSGFTCIGSSGMYPKMMRGGNVMSKY